MRSALRSSRLEAKLRESLDFFNDTRSVGLRRDRRRTSYQLAGEIEALLEAKWTRRLSRAWRRLTGSASLRFAVHTGSSLFVVLGLVAFVGAICLACGA